MENYAEKINQSFQDQARLLKKTGIDFSDQIAEMGLNMAELIRSGGKLLIAGNGGSAADAQHMAAEISGRYLHDRPGLAAMALTVDTSVITAVANDLGFENIFSRQIQALGRPGDGLVIFSTSGSSPNLVRAFEQACEKNMSIFLVLGKTGGRLMEMAHIAGAAAIVVDSHETPRIQEIHQIIYHSLCYIIESELLP
jgi:D-sedoheptulose 7-phosphate isomerase